jgi:hypothetical protein
LTIILTNSEIARALSVPVANVDLYWPKIETCLDALGCGSLNSKIGALATIAVETAGTFEPLHEYGSDALHEKEYGGRPDLGNVHVGDGAKFAGRGFIQITGEFNYEAYGKKLGVDMVANPELACEPDAAAAIFASYWHEKKCDIYADAGRWADVRRRVNGGANGLPLFLRHIADLSRSLVEAQSAPPAPR